MIWKTSIAETKDSFLNYLLMESIISKSRQGRLARIIFLIFPLSW